MSDWFVYVLRCGDGSLYTGITTNVPRRLAEHASGGPRAAKYLRGRGPLELAFSVPAEDKSAALSMERWIKAQPKSRKEELIAGRLRWPDSD
ncbi:GIY-YIG nuclease family protein [Desulfomicrobium baculatum]|uniref:Excinuclease ABC C subunit domain protein n=1 Tax=Desulfomicrobium baculatum (strain DSM 4028 / VKM B-1378 / X) TaxID=525897 RepID=C7LW04_DESBD|nr:GIY-YIG nuclease family protein [Desulfomicrobium baculatum]ACU89822.1 Excinuclease ABC C subunit domain protein [Desulfomicrobium baculatum DSM 4028]